MLKKFDQKLMNAIIAAQFKVDEFIHKEKGAVDIVAIVVLIGIVVLVAVIFRKSLQNLINSLFNTINNTANEAVKK